MAANTWFNQTEARLYAYPALIAKHRKAITEYRLAAPSPKARNYTATSFIRGGNIEPEAERWVLSREKMAQRILFLEQHLQDEMDRVTALWEILSKNEKQFVACKYFEQRSLQTITDRLNYSRQTCNRIRARAVTKAAYIYGFISYEDFLNKNTV